MQAVAAITQERRVEVVDYPEPRDPISDEVLLRVLDVGVCGTDREIAAFQYGGPPSGEPHLILGHEALMRVEGIGNEVHQLQVGDLVVVTVRRPCTVVSCVACRMGRPDFCQTGEFTERGIRGAHGFMTELVLENAANCHVVPRKLRDVGVLTEPLTVAQKALLEAVQVQDRLPWLVSDRVGGRTALVLGAGPVGLLGAMALASRGFPTSVYSREPADSDKAQLVRALGATYLASEEVAIGELPRFDIIYEATGSAHLAFEALAALAANGMFIFTGVPVPKVPEPLDATRIMRDLVLQNQLIYGSVNASASSYDAAIEDLELFHARWPDELRGLITKRHSPQEGPRLLTEPPPGIKHVVSFEQM